MASPNDPSLPYFLLFIRNSMKINSSILPDGDPSIAFSYNVAVMLVNCNLQLVPNPDPINQPSYYTMAVYNLGGDRLINWAQDQPDAPNVMGSNPPLPYFAYTRNKLNIEGFVSGIVTATSDEGTSVSLQVPDWAVNATIADLQYLKTPWGRTYMGLAQAYGPNVWGIS